MIYIDCESAGLRGDIFACAMVNDAGDTIFNGGWEHPALKTNAWLRDNVTLSGTIYQSGFDFQQAAAEAWYKCREREAVAHMGSPVEANFFQQLYKQGLLGEFDGPCPLHDTATLLHAFGYNPLSEKDSARAMGIAMPRDYKEHEALSDARLTRLIWLSLPGSNR